MPELYKAYRADDCISLYGDFLADKTRHTVRAAFDEDGMGSYK
jgi:hypothetical protein